MVIVVPIFVQMALRSVPTTPIVAPMAATVTAAKAMMSYSRAVTPFS